MDPIAKWLIGITGAGAAYLALRSSGNEVPLPTWKPGAIPRMTDTQLARLAYSVGWRSDDLITAIAVAIAESGGYPDASAWNRMADGRTNHDRGLWQISSIHHPRFMDADAFNPRKNAAYAFQLWQHLGWNVWIAYSTGAHKRFLPRARIAVRSCNNAVSGVSTNKLTASEIARIARGVGFSGRPLAVMTAIGLAESDGDPTARNGQYVGIWQVASETHRLEPERLEDPIENALTARKLYLWANKNKPSPYQPWGAYNDGRYITWMDEAERAVKEISA